MTDRYMDEHVHPHIHDHEYEDEYHEHNDAPRSQAGRLLAALLVLIVLVLFIIYGLPYVSTGNYGVGNTGIKVPQVPNTQVQPR
ncbi:hypothetical protein M1349_03045 [Patescibacteria group bacterium]|nr:hypothetical protein [Patescibacteria group bacterium]